MKIIKHIPLIVALGLLVGCATTFRPWRLSEIQEGMGKAQVVKILGNPDSIETKNGAEFLYYTYSENHNPAPSDFDTRISDVSKNLQDRRFEKSFKEYKFVVILTDGKVQTYKELQQ